ncbi:hypothetical protein GC163_13220 [bacterium]|nr:hypothetical protein [bacterium]
MTKEVSDEEQLPDVNLKRATQRIGIFGFLLFELKREKHCLSQSVFRFFMNWFFLTITFREIVGPLHQFGECDHFSVLHVTTSFRFGDGALYPLKQ